MTPQENHRPTSPMNTDAKNPQQNINKPNSKYIKRVIHHYQTGFIPGLQGRCNISKLVNVKHCVNKRIKIMIISTGAEKAFDKM